MLVGERLLKLESAEGLLLVPVRIFLPEKLPVDWVCKFTIGWPDGEFEMEIHGVDAVQAIELAFKTIGAMIYSSDYHKAGALIWLKPGDGYGFPVVNGLRDLLVGDDKKYL